MIVLAPRTRTIIASARGAPGPDGPTGPAGDLARAANRAALQALTPGGSVLNRWLAESGREGLFQWDASDLSAEVTADTAQALYVPPASDTTGASGAWVRKHDGHWLPEWFGAVGDGASKVSRLM